MDLESFNPDPLENDEKCRGCVSTLLRANPRMPNVVCAVPRKPNPPAPSACVGTRSSFSRLT